VEGFCERGDDSSISIKCWEFLTEDQATSYEGLCSADVVFYTVTVSVSGAIAPSGARASSFTRFLDHTQRRTTLRRTPLDE
jgi:hypothetical protein